MRPTFVVVLVFVAACSDDPEGTSLPRTLSGDGGAAGDHASDAATSPTTDGGAKTDAADAAVHEESGQATYYNANGTGACGFPASTDYMVCAMNAAEYSKSLCGKCLSVTGPRGTVVVRIVDECPGCGRGDLDLSETAFSKIARLSDGRVAITWHYVTCP